MPRSAILQVQRVSVLNSLIKSKPLKFTSLLAKLLQTSFKQQQQKALHQSRTELSAFSHTFIFL